ncbi:hypothetical protein [Burkholderia ubonensis]|uniref:hypothetical protein n=1 Tax=Burkholderia ubonensis TaxID=101571 RepID=UPI0009B4A9BE|nr:hypothetical protein [Burkholderia ubonensis]
MDLLKVFDAYSLRARLFPAIIAAAPALAALTLLISWKSFELSNAIAMLAVFVLLFAIADIARARGRAVERDLYAKHAGTPSIIMFRRSDSTIENGLKERYRAFLAARLGVTAPTAEEELASQNTADAFYEQCGVWLRQNTRDTKKFPLLFAENITYGFRRNLLGVKWLALALNLLVVCICVGLLWRVSWAIGSEQGKRTIVVLLVAASHAVYMLSAVRRCVVWEAAQAYGRELILSCEAFLSTPTASAKKSVTRTKAVPND